MCRVDHHPALQSRTWLTRWPFCLWEVASEYKDFEQISLIPQNGVDDTVKPECIDCTIPRLMRHARVLAYINKSVKQIFQIYYAMDGFYVECIHVRGVNFSAIFSREIHL